MLSHVGVCIIGRVPTSVIVLEIVLEFGSYVFFSTTCPSRVHPCRYDIAMILIIAAIKGVKLPILITIDDQLVLNH